MSYAPLMRNPAELSKLGSLASKSIQQVCATLTGKQSDANATGCTHRQASRCNRYELLTPKAGGYSMQTRWLVEESRSRER